jgi:hypothetical protein
MRFRHLSLLLAALALTLGLVSVGLPMAEMSPKVAAAVSGDMTMPGTGCDDCGGGGDAMMAGCSVTCVGVIALLPTQILTRTADRSLPLLLLSEATIGRNGPPDPYPPRPIVLS